MFHHTHLYITSKLYNSQDNLLLVGSFLPDLAVTGIIKWEGGLHGQDSVKNFSEFISKFDPTFVALSKGILAHNILDDFTHKDYKNIGYAYLNNKKLVDLVSKYYKLDSDQAKGKAHNYIESGVDILLLEKFPEIQTQLKQTIKQIDVKKLSFVLANYFNSDSEIFYQSLIKFLDLFTKYDFSKMSEWILFWSDLEDLLDLKKTTIDQKKELLLESIKVTKDTYQDFLNYSLEKGVTRI